MYSSLPARPLGWTLVVAGLLMVAALLAVAWQDLSLVGVLAPLALGVVLISLGLLVLSAFPRHRAVAVRVAAGGLVLLGLAALVVRALV